MKDAVRVCFLSTHAYPLFNPGADPPFTGGAEVQFHHLAVELAADPRFDVSLVAGDFGQAAVEVREGVTLYRAATPLPSDGALRRLGQAVGCYRLLGLADADVYLTTATTANILLVSLFCRRRGRKHIHRTAHEREAGELHTRPGLAAWLYRRGFRMTDLIVTQNDAHREALKRVAGVEAVVLRNAFPRRERPSGRERRHVLWMARCLPWKRPEMFLALAERFPGEKFVMVAPGCGDRAAAPVVARAKRMPNLTLIERVPFREVQDLFDGATLFVNTSEQEGFPNTFLHAGLGATPIVSLAVDPDGFIARHGCGIVCNGSPGQMERAVARLLADPAERQRLGCAAYEYVRRNHDLGAVAGELKAILLSLTRGSGTRRPTLQKSR